MAWLLLRNDSYRVAFRYGNKQHVLIVGKVSAKEAERWKSRTEDKLMRIKQRYTRVPRGCTIEDFIRHDGNPPAEEPDTAEMKLDELREKYVAAFSNGAIEANTLYTTKLHVTRLQETLGKRCLVSGVNHAALQRHIDLRTKTVTPITVKKEIDSFRVIWNWGVRTKIVTGTFPSAGLVYPKTEDKLPYMPWAEIERRIKSGGGDELWECLYLDADQVAKAVAYAESKKMAPWVFPMIATAAYTGARRSELLRAEQQDVDLKNRVMTIREKKRSRGHLTTRRVPLNDRLLEILKPHLTGKRYLFGGDRELSVQSAQKAFVRMFKGSKWDKLRGWHIFRHSLISILASKGVDQRVIDDLVSHSTEQQRKRYRHLFPDVTRKAVVDAFS